MAYESNKYIIDIPEQDVIIDITRHPTNIL